VRNQHPLSVEDIESVLDALVYEGRVEMECGVSSDGRSVRQYRIVSAWTPSAGLTRMPCGMCPVSMQACASLMIACSCCVIATS
jgi:hypothetical protein